MDKEWITVRVVKDGKYAAILIAFVFNIFFIIELFLILNSERSLGHLLLLAPFLIFFFVIAWTIPLIIYLPIPRKIALTESELIMRTRYGTEKRSTREQIRRVTVRKSPITGEIMYGVYCRKNPNASVALDKESGRQVWEWYYGEKSGGEEERSHP